MVNSAQKITAISMLIGLCVSWSRDQLSVNTKTVSFFETFFQYELKEHVSKKEIWAS